MTGYRKSDGTHRSPLSILSNSYDWLDYYIFRDHLRVPRPYLKVIFRKCPDTLGNVVHNLHKVFLAVDNHAWEKIMAESSMREKLCRVANIPPMYFEDRPVVTSRPSDQVNFGKLLKNVEKLTGTFYFHSEFCDAALNAAASLVKAAIDKRMRSVYCASFPTIMAEHKQEWDTRSALQTHVREDALVVIYAVGGEYTTEFTNNLLQDTLRHREMNNKTTVVCSALCPSDYATRYSAPHPGIEIGFADEKIKKTLAVLVKELGL